MAPNFKIISNGIISASFIKKGITTAAQYIKNLPYKRNTDKTDPLAVFNENCGTCSTKHALLSALAIENNQTDIELKLGIFKMAASFSAAVGNVLAKYKLPYIPEAHNYLCYNGEIFDYTFSVSPAYNFADDLMDEITITPQQITDFKVSYHKAFIQSWQKTEALDYTPEELWIIREECITALASA
jgi:hypothetical protein